MAFTVTRTQLSDGNYRTVVVSMVADAATQNVDTGLSKIFGHSMAPRSLSTGAIKIYPNSGAGGTAIAGTLGISGCTSGDEFVVCVYGV